MAQENYQFTNALKRLSPDLQKKITLFTKNPPLPVWPEQTHGIPNLFIRSALFGVIERGHRKMVVREKISSFKGLHIRYTGWKLDQGDFDVLLQVFNLASRQQQSSNKRLVQFTMRGFLRAIGRDPGKSGREWLKASFERLSGSTLEVEIEIRHTYETEKFTYTGSLVEEVRLDNGPHGFFLKINPKLGKLFDAGWTMLQVKQRICLKTNLAKWLHGFYASHRDPYPIKVVTLQQLCGSEYGRLSDFRCKLRLALTELVGADIISSWLIDPEDKVRVQKPATKSIRPLDQGA